MEKGFEEQIDISRKKLKGPRGPFWEDNRKNFKRNVKKIIDSHPLPKGWKLYVAASNFLFDEKIFPFDYDSWSSTNLIAASKKQGYEIMIFLNKARLEFLSLPALVHLIAHEMVHVKQAARNPTRYLDSITNDALAKTGEIEAERTVAPLEEFRKQWVLESVVFCHDYGGGYDQGLEDSEYKAFKKAMKEKDINLFIDYF